MELEFNTSYKKEMQSPEKNERIISSIINIIFTLIIGTIGIIVIFFHSSINFTCKRNFDMSNIQIALIYICFVLIFVNIYAISQRKKYKLKVNIGDKQMVILTCLLFVCQVYYSVNIYFKTGWDVNVVWESAQLLASTGSIVDWYSGYLLQYPNNTLLTVFFAAIIYINQKIGIFSLNNVIYLVIVLQCIISSIVCFLTYKIVSELKSKNWGFASWILYVMLLGFSPWLVIPYSDSVGLFFPTVVLYLYMIIEKKNNHKWIINFLIMFISYIGYKIKPQTFVLFIAIVIVSVITFILNIKNANYKLVFRNTIVPMFAGLILGFIMVSFAYKSTDINFNKDRQVGMTHYLMLGLNNETDGVYSASDVAYSMQFDTYDERCKGNLSMIKKRLKEYGASGLALHLVKKTLVNFSDGTYSWGAEGEFYSETYADINSVVAPYLKSLVYNDGSRFHISSSIYQMIWIGILISMLGCSIGRKKEKIDVITVMMLGIIGITAFVMLFEARARYLYTFVPLYIMLAVLSFSNISRRYMKLCQYFRNNKLD